MDPSLWGMSCHAVLLGEIKGEVSALCVPCSFAAAVSCMELIHKCFNIDVAQANVLDKVGFAFCASLPKGHML